MRQTVKDPAPIAIGGYRGLSGGVDAALIILIISDWNGLHNISGLT
jgi:hypothetical protein